MNDKHQRQVSHESVVREYDRKGMIEVLSTCYRTSAPQNRAAAELLRLDLNETFAFLSQHPDALRQVSL